MFRLASGLSGRGILLTTALVFCFGLAYLASVIGLAPIVGQRDLLSSRHHGHRDDDGHAAGVEVEPGKKRLSTIMGLDSVTLRERMIAL